MELHLNFPRSIVPSLGAKVPKSNSMLLLARKLFNRPHKISSSSSSSSTSTTMMTLEQPGGKMVVELVGAFNELTERMSHNMMLSTSSSRLLFKALKLSIPILHTLPLLPDGRSPLAKTLSIALILADLQVISAGLLREVVDGGVISMYQVRDSIGTATAHLLHETMRLKNVSSKVEVLDDEGASALRKFCVTYYDVRAIILDLVLKLDTMRHPDYLPRYRQKMISLEVMKIYAPLAHAVSTNVLLLELEVLAFQHLFPYSYVYVDTWLRSYENGCRSLIDDYSDQLLRSLKEMVQDIIAEGRYKSRYSTMKKLLRDGRHPRRYMTF